MTKPKITQTEYNELCKTLKNTYDIIPDEMAASDEAYMNIENKKRTATLRKDGRYIGSVHRCQGQPQI